jgi:hypothetical protein
MTSFIRVLVPKDQLSQTRMLLFQRSLSGNKGGDCGQDLGPPSPAGVFAMNESSAKLPPALVIAAGESTGAL